MLAINELLSDVVVCRGLTVGPEPALLRKRILDLISTERPQRVEYDRDIDRLLKQGAYNGREITKRCGGHTE